MGVLSTVEKEMVNDASPINNQYNIGDRMSQLTTVGCYGTVTTAGSSNTTASVEADFHGPHGIVYCTSSGYYTLKQPVAGCHLTWFYFGADDQFIRARQAGTGATGPSFTYGTGSTYMVIETTIQSGMSLEFYGLSSEIWLVGSHTSDDGLLGLATSS